MFENFQFLSFSEIIYAAVLALLITWTVRSFMRVNKVIKSVSTSFKYNIDDIGTIVDKCYQMFPLEDFKFKGETFTRGMKIKIKTVQNTVFEGELIGANSKNVLCIKTNKYIMAHEIRNIGEISKI